MTIYESIVRSDAPIRKIYDDFYGTYNDLRGSLVPTEGAIKAFQMSKLHLFSIMARSGNFKAQAVNNFLQNSSGSIDDGLQYSIIHNKILELENKLRGAFFAADWSKAEQDNQLIDKNLLELTHQNLKELYNLLLQISTFNNEPVSGTYINKLNGYINNLKGSSIYEIMKNYWNLQGEILEAEGTAWFNKRLPSDLKIKAYNIGKINVSGKGQAISDILLMDMSLVDLYENIFIDYTIGGQHETKTLKEFFNFLETHQGQEQIVLNDENLGKLISRSVMGIQAKSGKNQKPWNIKSKNTWVSIGEFDEPERRVLDRIFDLKTTWNQFDKNIKIQDNAYNALADYGLATVLNKVLHLDEYENSYLLTPSGFMTYEDRMEELLNGKGGKYYFHLNNVKMDYNLYDKKQIIMPD